MLTDLKSAFGSSKILSTLTENGTGDDIANEIFNPVAASARRFTANDIHQNEVFKQKQAKAIADGIEANKELLASPGKLEAMVNDHMKSIYPFAKAPNLKGAEVKSAAIDNALGDHPLAGSATAIKEKFKQALADPRSALLSHNQLLDAVKKEHLSAPTADGKSLLEKAHEYKYKKDNIMKKIENEYHKELVAQDIWEILLLDPNLRCTCDEVIREKEVHQAQGHYHHCMLWQVAHAVEICLRLMRGDGFVFDESRKFGKFVPRPEAIR